MKLFKSLKRTNQPTIEKEQEYLKLFNQIINDNQLDQEALDQIIKANLSSDITPNENVKSMLKIYNQTFFERSKLIEDLLCQTSIFTKDQLEMLSNIAKFYSGYNKQYKRIYKDKFKSYNKFISWITKELNIEIQQNTELNNVQQQINQEILEFPQWNIDNKQQNNEGSDKQSSKQLTKIQLPINQVSHPILIEENQPSGSARAQPPDLFENVDPALLVNPIKVAKKQFEKSFLQNFKELLEKNIQIKEKNYSGNIVLERFNEQEFADFTDTQLKKFKRSCLKNKQKLFDSPELLIGTISSIVVKEEDSLSYLQIIIFIGNKLKYPLFNCSLLLEEAKGLSFWAPEINLPHQIERRKQEKYVFIIQYEYLLFKPVKACFEWIENDELKEAEFLVPCFLPKFMNFLQCTKRQHKAQWSRQLYPKNRSGLFKLNQKIITNPLKFQKYWPQLIILSNCEDYFNLNKDLKFGGIFTLQNINKKYYIKIIIRADYNCVIKIIGLYDSQILISNLVYILSE